MSPASSLSMNSPYSCSTRSSPKSFTSVAFVPSTSSSTPKPMISRARPALISTLPIRGRHRAHADARSEAAPGDRPLAPAPQPMGSDDSDGFRACRASLAGSATAPAAAAPAWPPLPRPASTRKMAPGTMYASSALAVPPVMPKMMSTSSTE